MTTDIEKFAMKVAKLNNLYARQNKVESRTPRIRMGNTLPEPLIISTGNPALDWGLSGGIPEGTIFEFYGPPSTGKSTAMSYVMSEIQKLNKIVIYYHTEESFKPQKAWKLAGVDESKVCYIDARRSGEDGINQIKSLILDEDGLPSSVVGMIVIDSVSALAPAAEINSVGNNGMEGVTVGRLAALTSKLFRIICGSGWLHEGCILGLVNQERAQIGQVPLPNVTSGGHAIPYYAKIRVQLKAPTKGFVLDENKQVIGHTIEYYVSKNNTGGAPFRRGSWKVIYGKGIDYLGPMIDEAMSYGIIQEVAKSRYVVRWLENEAIKSSEKIHGKTAVTDYIEKQGNTIQHGIQLAISKVREFAANSSVAFIEGTAYLGQEEIDILDKVTFSREEHTVVPVPQELPSEEWMQDSGKEEEAQPEENDNNDTDEFSNSC
jgi:recombination protein RecA